MLSERDQQTLAEIELRFAGETPHPPLSMPAMPSDLALRRSRRCYDGVIIVAVVLAVIFLALQQDRSTDAGVIAACFAVLTFGERCRRFRPQRAPRGQSG